MRYNNNNNEYVRFIFEKSVSSFERMQSFCKKLQKTFRTTIKFLCQLQYKNFKRDDNKIMSEF